jgi:hypothetical protein
MPALKSLTDEELAEILALVKDADSVELKRTVRETARAKTVAAICRCGISGCSCRSTGCAMVAC